MTLNKKYFGIGLFLLILLNGCSKDHLDPTQIGRFRPMPSVNVILNSLGVADEGQSEYAGAEPPRPSDVTAREPDYTFNSGDSIRISIFELLQEGVQYAETFVVNESGNISIPEIGQLQASGLTESQLEGEITKALSPGILKNPSVTVSLLQSQSRVFTVLGDGVAKPGRYAIPRYDYRLLDALADAGSAKQFNVSYIYVSRRITGDEKLSTANSQTLQQSAQPQQRRLKLPEPDNTPDNTNKPLVVPQNQDLLKIIQPSVLSSAGNSTGAGNLVISSAEMATDDELASLAAPEALGKNAVQAEDSKDSKENIVTTLPKQKQTQPEIEWVFKNGKWVPVEKKPAGTEPEQMKTKTNAKTEPVIDRSGGKNTPNPSQRPQWPPKEQPIPKKSVPMNFGWDQIDNGGIQTRVIKIPKDKLFGGDPRYNIIIKPGDTITAQLDMVGEFYVLGNVNNQGIINLTGRPMTLKMAIAAAGGLGPLAWPKKCEVIRRIGKRKEEIVMVDLAKIANGTQPDFFIKPNDVINVGTHGVSRWMAVLRNAFRASYGFGFIYDRNFAYPSSYYTTTNPF